MTDKKEKQKALLNIIQDAIVRDQQLREKHKIGEKFRFVRDRLQAIASKLTMDLDALELQEQKIQAESPKDEVVVYVYVFNAHGLDLRSWMKMLTPKIFYEHSVNRPIYAEEAHVESFIRSKQNKFQHAYLTVAVRQSDIVSRESGQDGLLQPLVKVKENSLRFDKLITFSHAGHVYTLTEDGELVKKH